MKRKSKVKMRRALSSVIVTAMSVSMLSGVPASAEIGKATYDYDGYVVEYNVTNEWGNTQTVEVTLLNTGSSPILNWSLRYDSEGEITNLWNAEIYKQSSDEYIIKNADWNYKIEPGQSVTYGYTLNGSAYSKPDSFEINSKRVDVVEGYTAQLNIKREWETGVEGEIVLTNTSDKPLEAWTLSFDSNVTITNLWNAEITESNNGHYTISSELWTNPIPSGDFAAIGFIGEKDAGVEPLLSNFSLASITVDDEDDVDLPDLDADVIDLGCIENLNSAGLIDVIQDEEGRIRTINGKFTNKTVNSPEEAATVLNAASSLFGSRFHADASNITVQQDGDEMFYRYSPEVNGIPVSGSQIIISTINGIVTGLFSTYNNAIENINPFVNPISSAEATETACNDFFFNQNFSEIVDMLTDESGLPKEEVISILRDALSINAYLKISDARRDPKLTWVVTLEKYYTSENDESFEYGDDEYFEIALEDDDFVYEAEDVYTGIDVVYNYVKYVSVYYEYTIYACGENAGDIIYIDDGVETVTWEGTTTSAIDFKSNSRDINVSYNNIPVPNRYIMFDKTRQIQTYKTKYISGGIIDLPGRIIESKDNTWSTNSAAVSAHANMAEVYDYYNNVLHWKSFDNNGTTIKISLNYKRDYDATTNTWEDCKNAAWLPQYKQFGIGNKGDYYAALDVMGHEYTHAVMRYKVGKMGQDKETLALKESYSDIMGNLIENKNDSNKWKIGEDSSGSERDMRSPSIEKYKDIDWKNDTKHQIGEVFNHAAYYMMVDGRTKAVTNSRWTELFFNSMNRLTSDATFLDARGAILTSASCLNFTNPEQQAIKDAFDKVDICEPNVIRIVLRWGDKPRDLDSHLTGPTVDNSSQFHIYYSNRHYFEDNTFNSGKTLYASDLDYDDTSSYGPEITTIRKLTPGDYYFYVHDFTNRSSNNSTELCNSGAYIEIFKGMSKTPMSLANGAPARFTINSNSVATLWTVCRINIDSNGNVTIYPINSFSNHEDPATVG